eukprot:c7865_g1_i1.p1 GENE.c7865_g1_i1~~c7865_g1_i1.p1  ORF type:complete len:433 (-),score=144.43 c7865_g1_i1:28-1326(-)
MSVKSIKCNLCGLVLMNGEEVKLHADQSGHAQFEESDQAPTIWKCTICTKPCRSLTEKDIHTKRTNHAEFEETEWTKSIDIVADIKQIREASAAELREEMSLLTNKPVPVPKQEEMVEPELDQSLLGQLEEMGFARVRAQHAVYNCRDSPSLESAVTWLAEQDGNPEFDVPLLVPKSSVASSFLTPEETARKIEELRLKNKARREAEEKQEAIRREKERIQSGRAVNEMRKAAEDLVRKRELEAMKREKEEERLAKIKMKQTLRREREERLKAAGQWTAEMEAESKRLDEEDANPSHRPAARSAAQPTQSRPSVTSEKNELREAFVQVKKENADPNVQTVAIQTLQAYISNIAKNPEEEKFRKINTANNAFKTRVAVAHGAVRVLEAVGFQSLTTEEGTFFHLPRDRVDGAVLTRALQIAHDALSNPYFGVL